MASSRRSGTRTDTVGRRATRGSAPSGVRGLRRCRIAARRRSPLTAAMVSTAQAESAISSPRGSISAPISRAPSTAPSTGADRPGCIWRQLSEACVRASARSVSASCPIRSIAAVTSACSAITMRPGPRPLGKPAAKAPNRSGREEAKTVDPPTRRQGTQPAWRSVAASWPGKRRGSGGCRPRSIALVPHCSASASSRSRALATPCARSRSRRRASERRASASTRATARGSARPSGDSALGRTDWLAASVGSALMCRAACDIARGQHGASGLIRG